MPRSGAWLARPEAILATVCVVIGLTACATRTGIEFGEVAGVTRAQAASTPVGPSASGVASPGAVAAPDSTPAADLVLSDVPTTPHPTPVEEVFENCQPTGSADGHGDPDLNRLKNRIDDGPWRP